jgi:protoheme ferro-lyase
MTDKTTEALKLAEKTLRDIIGVYKFETGTPVTALAAIRQALAEQEKQEPVAYALSHLMGLEFGSKYPMQETKEAAEQMARQHMGAVVVTPLYVAPVDAASIRSEALEEAAKWFEGKVGQADLRHIAPAIRGLK